MKPLGYIPRLISTHIQKLMEMYPVVTIARPRQSGMTFTPAMVKNVEKFAKFCVGLPSARPHLRRRGYGHVPPCANLQLYSLQQHLLRDISI